MGDSLGAYMSVLCCVWVGVYSLKCMSDFVVLEQLVFFCQGGNIKYVVTMKGSVGTGWSFYTYLPRYN